MTSETGRTFKPSKNAGAAGVEYISAGSEALPEGSSIEAIYLGTVKNPRTGKADVKLQRANGQMVILNAAGNLNYRLEDEGAEVDKAVIITYLGKTPMAKGPFKGTPAHSFAVQVET